MDPAEYLRQLDKQLRDKDVEFGWQLAMRDMTFLMLEHEDLNSFVVEAERYWRRGVKSAVQAQETAEKALRA